MWCFTKKNEVVANFKVLCMLMECEVATFAERITFKLGELENKGVTKIGDHMIV